MKNKLLITALFLFTNALTFAQENVIIGTKDNVEISYQLTKLESNAKKDKYLISVTAQNKNNYNLYYPVIFFKNANGSETLSPLIPTGFSKIVIRNSTGWFGDGKQVSGLETTLKTENNEVLFNVENNKIYNFETEFNVKHDDKPIITNTYGSTLRKLEEFNIAINDTFINGVWVSNCGNNSLALSLLDENGTKIILQSVNGNQIRWINTSTTNFTKENDNNSTLTYSKTDNKFLYSSSDGNNCEWTKK